MGSTIAEYMHNNEFVVADEYLSKEDYQYLKDYLYSPRFPWFFVPNAAGTNDRTNKDSYGFSFLLFDQWKTDLEKISVDHKKVIDLFTDALKRDFDIEYVHRIRAGLQLPVPSGTSYNLGPHVDLDFVHYTALFYFCEETGGTGTTVVYKEKKDLYLSPSYMFNKEHEELTVEQEIEPKENRVLIFRGDKYHAAKQPVKLNRRIAVNVNFVGWPKVSERIDE
jgi:hypothetical protein